MGRTTTIDFAGVSGKGNRFNTRWRRTYMTKGHSICIQSYVSLKSQQSSHRVDRLLGVCSSRPNWDPPLPRRRLSPLPLWFRRVVHSLAGEGVEGPNSHEVYMYFVVQPDWCSSQMMLSQIKSNIYSHFHRSTSNGNMLLFTLYTMFIA